MGDTLKGKVARSTGHEEVQATTKGPRRGVETERPQQAKVRPVKAQVKGRDATVFVREYMLETLGESHRAKLDAWNGRGTIPHLDLMPSHEIGRALVAIAHHHVLSQTIAEVLTKTRPSNRSAALLTSLIDAKLVQPQATPNFDDHAPQGETSRAQTARDLVHDIFRTHLCTFNTMRQLVFFEKHADYAEMCRLKYQRDTNIMVAKGHAQGVHGKTATTIANRLAQVESIVSLSGRARENPAATSSKHILNAKLSMSKRQRTLRYLAATASHVATLSQPTHAQLQSHEPPKIHPAWAIIIRRFDGVQRQEVKDTINEVLRSGNEFANDVLASVDPHTVTLGELLMAQSEISGDRSISHYTKSSAKSQRSRKHVNVEHTLMRMAEKGVITSQHAAEIIGSTTQTMVQDPKNDRTTKPAATVRVSTGDVFNEQPTGFSLRVGKKTLRGFLYENQKKQVMDAFMAHDTSSKNRADVLQEMIDDLESKNNKTANTQLNGANGEVTGLDDLKANPTPEPNTTLPILLTWAMILEMEGGFDVGFRDEDVEEGDLRDDDLSEASTETLNVFQACPLGACIRCDRRREGRDSTGVPCAPCLYSDYDEYMEDYIRESSKAGHSDIEPIANRDEIAEFIAERYDIGPMALAPRNTQLGSSHGEITEGDDMPPKHVSKQQVRAQRNLERTFRDVVGMNGAAAAPLLHQAQQQVIIAGNHNVANAAGLIANPIIPQAPPAPPQPRLTEVQKLHANLGLSMEQLAFSFACRPGNVDEYMDYRILPLDVRTWAESIDGNVDAPANRPERIGSAFRWIDVAIGVSKISTYALALYSIVTMCVAALEYKFQTRPEPYVMGYFTNNRTNRVFKIMGERMVPDMRLTYALASNVFAWTQVVVGASSWSLVLWDKVKMQYSTTYRLQHNAAVDRHATFMASQLCRGGVFSLLRAYFDRRPWDIYPESKHHPLFVEGNTILSDAECDAHTTDYDVYRVRIITPTAPHPQLTTEDERLPSNRGVAVTHHPLPANCIVERVKMRPALAHVPNVVELLDTREVDVRTLLDAYTKCTGNSTTDAKLSVLTYNKRVGVNQSQFCTIEGFTNAFIYHAIISHQIVRNYQLHLNWAPIKTSHA